VTDRPASGAALWRLNVAGLLREALERSDGGVISQAVAGELVTRWFAEHPEERKSPSASRWNKRKRDRRADEQPTDARRPTADELLAKARRLERDLRRP
jgi:hypothetical protein